jgi:hypothetical protein
MQRLPRSGQGHRRNQAQVKPSGQQSMRQRTMIIEEVPFFWTG